MSLMLSVLSLLALLACGVLAVRPLTKEKAFFAVVALLVGYGALLSAPTDEAGVADAVEAARVEALAEANDPAFAEQALEDIRDTDPFEHEGRATHGDEAPPVLATLWPDLVLARPYGAPAEGVSGRRARPTSLFRREERVRPLGRVWIGAPGVPSISVSATAVDDGPSRATVAVTRPFGIVNPGPEGPSEPRPPDRR